MDWLTERLMTSGCAQVGAVTIGYDAMDGPGSEVLILSVREGDAMTVVGELRGEPARDLWAALPARPSPDTETPE